MSASEVSHINGGGNKWLNSTIPQVDSFTVDKTHEDYFIQYSNSKTDIVNLNEDWSRVKDLYGNLKIQIEDLKSAIDSQDYRSQTTKITEAIDTSIAALDDNFTALFNSAVKRLYESAESDEWFSETASLYASYIWTAILGNAPIDKSRKGSEQIPTVTTTSPDVSKEEEHTEVDLQAETTPSNTPSTGGSGGGGTPASSSDTAGGDGSADALKGSADTAGGDAEPVELSATSIQNSAAPSTGTVDTSKYHDKPESGFVVTTDNPKYQLSDADIELLTAIVSAESDKSYDDALAVASTIFNRCEEPKWAYMGGSNPVKQATAPNQFVVYQHGSYKKYMGNGAPDTCRQAVLDVMNGARNHNYLSFRSNGSKGYSSNMITSSGNRYK